MLLVHAGMRARHCVKKEQRHAIKEALPRLPPWKMKPPESIKELCRKIKALADQGIGGEKAEAARKLSALLVKHGLKIEDVLREEQIAFPIPFKGPQERQLLVQVCAMITNRPTIGLSIFPGGKCAWVRSTLAEQKDIEAAFAYYRLLLIKAKREQAKAVFEALIMKYKLWSKDGADSEEKATPQEIERIISAMRGINGEAWSKPKEQLKE